MVSDYCEIAVSGLQNRNQIIRLSDFKLTDQRNEVYRSLFLFNDGLKAWVERTGSVKGYAGPHTTDAVAFDLDGEDLHAVQAEAIRLVQYLTEVLEVPANYIRAAFSGFKGLHVVIPIEAFTDAVKPSLHFYKVVKAVAEELSSGFSFIDSSIYEPKRLFRVLNSINGKSGLHKIPLTFSELLTLPTNEIKTLARSPRRVDQLPPSEIRPVEALREIWDKWVRSDFDDPRSSTSARKQKVVDILQGVGQGSRNTAASRLAGLFISKGFDEDFTVNLVSIWNQQNNPPLLDEEVARIVHGAYRRYKKDDAANVTVYDFAKAGEAYRNFVSSSKTAKVNTGFESLDYKLRGIVPGETCCILGKTSVGKSAFLQNIGMNYARATGRNVLMYSLEVPITSVFERAAQIEFGLSGGEIESGFQQNLDDVTGFAKMLFTKVPTFFTITKSGLDLDAIRSITRFAETEVYHSSTGLILIDYLGLVKGAGRDVYEQVSRVARGMKDLAKELNVPIIFLSQVNRNYTEFDPLAIGAARDSGAVDEASDFVLGLWKDDNRPLPNDRSADDTTMLILGILKNRRGGIGQTPLLMDRPSLRVVEDREAITHEREYAQRLQKVTKAGKKPF